MISLCVLYGCLDNYALCGAVIVRSVPAPREGLSLGFESQELNFGFLFHPCPSLSESALSA